MILRHPRGTRDNARGDESMAEMGDTILGKKLPSSDHYTIIQSNQTVPDRHGIVVLFL